MLQSSFCIVLYLNCINWGEWPRGLRYCSENWKVPGASPTRRQGPDLENQPCYKAPNDLGVEYLKRSD